MASARTGTSVTLVTDPPAPTGSVAGWHLRAWRAPVRVHLAVLGLVLVGLMAVVGTSASFSADEGAVILQARSLARGDGWIVPHPVPEADPDGVAYPLELSAGGSRGMAPFAKHPLYAIVLAGAARVGGINAMVALSLLGTVAAAAVAAALASRMGGPGLARPALWGVGLGTPLLLDGYLVIAHTLGAALAGATVLVAARAVERRKPVLAFAVGILAAVTVLFRTEALLLAAALALVVGLLALRRRGSERGTAALVGGAAVAGAGLALVAERLWSTAIVGAATLHVGSSPSSAGDAGYLAGRVRSFALTWLRPSYDGGTGDLILVVMAAAVALAVLAARRHPGENGPITVLAVVAAAASVLAVVIVPATVVPGLLIASPLVLAGLVAVRRSHFVSSGTTATLAAGTFAGFALAVLATQYSTGGSFEWGGRYFAIGLPLVVPVGLLALRQVGESLAPTTRRLAAAGLVVCTLSMAVMSVGAIRETRRLTGEMMVAIDRAARTIDARPVILTTERAVPRTAWATFDRQRWLLDLSDDLSPVVGRLRGAGIDRIALVSSRRTETLLRQLGPGVTVVSADAWAQSVGWRVLVLELA